MTFDPNPETDITMLPECIIHGGKETVDVDKLLTAALQRDDPDVVAVYALDDGTYVVRNNPDVIVCWAPLTAAERHELSHGIVGTYTLRPPAAGPR